MHHENKKQILLITPPFTQLNTPYPATAYLKGYLNTLGYSTFQIDLSLETILQVFTKNTLEEIFSGFDGNSFSKPSGFDMFHKRHLYINRVEPVISFLQGNNALLAHTIVKRNYLPEGSRFENLEDLEWAFGTLGLEDKAKYLATLFLEDMGDFITSEVDEDFGFSRYAERISRTASDFTPLFLALQTKNTIITQKIEKLVAFYIQKVSPDFVCITAPFPGNVFSAFFIAKIVKKIRPETVCILGGGYVNTELRSVYDDRVFQFFDYITLDDGETPLRKILEKHATNDQNAALKRTYHVVQDCVMYQNDCKDFDVAQRDVGTPDYADLLLDKYISVLEVLNPMHRVWSDGRWNKMTLAHGCYWGKCSFCDVTLDYIGRYEPVDAKILCGRIETILKQTGDHGFHFVDEAAPPSLMKDLAIELLRRNIQISWWTNIRFEKAFTSDLCRLLSASGCFAVTGGLEVASDRLLTLMEKGVTVEQVANVAYHFTSSDILVHTYLMYGFPTQTAQETIDSLEIVRQMIEAGIIQSGFWHLFAMTSHSPVGINPETYSVIKTGPEFMGFADNDCYHEDALGTDHEKFSEGLRVSLFNYMQEIGFEVPLQKWFDFSVPKTKIPKNYIKSILSDRYGIMKSHQTLIWIGGEVIIKQTDSETKTTLLAVYSANQISEIQGNTEIIQFLLPEIEKMNPGSRLFEKYRVERFKKEFTSIVTTMTFDEFEQSYLFYRLRETGLLCV